MRYLIISLIFLMVSCATSTTSSLLETNLNVTQVVNPYFSDVKMDYVYKAKINAFDHVFGGILIVKKIKENNHRVVFTTNFGNKIFDLEFLHDETIEHFIMKELDKKIIMNTLKRDFKTLIQKKNSVNKTFKDEDHIIYQSKLNNRYNYYFINAKTQVLTKITHSSKRKEKVIILFREVHKSIAKKILIQHKNTPVKINLKYLNNN